MIFHIALSHYFNVFPIILKHGWYLGVCTKIDSKIEKVTYNTNTEEWKELTELFWIQLTYLAYLRYICPIVSMFSLIIIKHVYLDVYDKVSDIVESWVWFTNKTLTPRRMHYNGFLIAEIDRWCINFPNMYDMLKAKVDRLVGKTYLVQKKIKNSLFSVAKYRHHLILRGSGGQTVDTRSTFGVPLKLWGITEWSWMWCFL